jgi:thiosulfate dehydrogenase [quinone] large subunit
MFSSRTAPFRFGMVMAAIAAVWTLVHIILGIAGFTGDDFWGYALLILFVLVLISAFVQYAQERPTLRSIGASERFPEPSISRFFLGSEGSSPLWFVIRMYVGAEWFLAGWEKVISPTWGTSGKAVAGFVSGALKLTVGAHPAVQGWYAWFLQNIVTPNVGLFSFLVSWGEVAVGLGILLGLLTGIAAGFGVLMNMNYLLAGTVSINPVLGMLGLFLCLSWRVCGWIGIDARLLPALGLPWKPGTWFHTADTATPPAAAQS